MVLSECQWTKAELTQGLLGLKEKETCSDSYVMLFELKWVIEPDSMSRKGNIIVPSVLVVLEIGLCTEEVRVLTGVEAVVARDKLLEDGAGGEGAVSSSKLEGIIFI